MVFIFIAGDSYCFFDFIVILLSCGFLCLRPWFFVLFCILYNGKVGSIIESYGSEVNKFY